MSGENAREMKRPKSSYNTMGSRETAFVNRLLKESQRMATYAAGTGLKVNPSTMKKLQELLINMDSDTRVDIEIVMEIHREFTKLIDPESPFTVSWLTGKSDTLIRIENPENFIWIMLGLTVFCLILFMALTTSDFIHKDILSKDYMERDGYEQFIIASFYIAAAGIGACIYNLFTIYRHKNNGTYNPKYNQTYWIRFVIGIVAGYLLAEVVSINIHENTLGKPFLAMLGGFSSDAVEWILIRFVDILKVSIKGSGDGQAANVKAEAKEEINRQATELQSDFISNLHAVHSAISRDADKDELREILNSIQSKYH